MNLIKSKYLDNAETINYISWIVYYLAQNLIWLPTTVFKIIGDTIWLKFNRSMPITIHRSKSKPYVEIENGHR